MKLLYKYGIFLLLILTLSCSESLEDLNIDPDKSPSARPQEVLTSAEGYLAWVIESRYSEDAALWAQYLTWGPGVAIGDAERYIMNGSTVNNLWSRTYANALTDLKFLTETEEPAFIGIAKILQAHTFQMLVDFFGSVPFSQAIQGEIEDGSVLAPTYDDGATIYAALIPMLDDAIAQLQSASAGDVGAEDLIYGGDLTKWMKFANSLKLRILMRQSVTSDQGAAVNALISNGNFIETEADAPFMAFQGDAGNENPMYADYESGVSNFYIASNTSLDVLNNLNDPRINKLYDPAPNSGSIVGILQGSVDDEPFTNTVDDYSQGSAITYAIDNPVIFMSPWEVWFLRAEAAARYSTADDETSTFTNAVTSHFMYLGLDEASAGDYVSSLGYDSGAALDDRIKQIAIQKWISLNGLQDPEGWTEVRRFDTPDNPIFTDPTNGIFKTPVASTLGQGVFPSSWVYPADEQSLNANAPAQKKITDKVFWDN